MEDKSEPPSVKELNSTISFCNEYYLNLLGYKPENTSLKRVPEDKWKSFVSSIGFNFYSSGIYLPRNQTAVIRDEDILSLFHEYFGHGLFCEQSLIGKKLVNLEKRLLEEEKQEFSSRKFSLDDLKRFREKNLTFQELANLRKQNLIQYELFAIWTEFLLSGRFGHIEDFERKYDSLIKKEREAIDSVIGFSEQYGDLATFYASGLARRTTPERVKRLLEDIYGVKTVNNSKLILLTGSKKPFSDIDLFASSDGLQSVKKNWFDLVAFDEKDFERRVRLFEVQVVCPVFKGEFVVGDERYLERLKEQLRNQPITIEAINYNFWKAEQQRQRALECAKDSEDRMVGFSYAQTYLANALALKKGLRLFSRKDLISFSQSEKFIELKGGIE